MKTKEPTAYLGSELTSSYCITKIEKQHRAFPANNALDHPTPITLVMRSINQVSTLSWLNPNHFCDGPLAFSKASSRTCGACDSALCEGLFFFQSSSLLEAIRGPLLKRHKRSQGSRKLPSSNPHVTSFLSSCYNLKSSSTFSVSNTRTCWT